MAMSHFVAVEQTFSLGMGRELAAEEAELLLLLSPQGMAKVNTDLARGVNLEQTLAELKVVLLAAQKRKALIEGLVPKAMLPALMQMRRPLTTEEMVLFAGTSAAFLEQEISCRTKEGEALEDVVHDLAQDHRQMLLQGSAQRLAYEQSKPVFLTPLSATQLDTSHPFGLTVSVTEVGEKSERLRIGLGPVVTWFAESDTLAECGSACTVASQSTLSPQSSCKRGPHLRLTATEIGSSSSLGLTRSSASQPSGALECAPRKRPTPLRIPREKAHVHFGGPAAIGETTSSAAQPAPLTPVPFNGPSSPRKRHLLAGTVFPAPPCSPPQARTEKRPWKLPLLRRLFTCHHSR
eukprot:RCo024908